MYDVGRSCKNNKSNSTYKYYKLKTFNFVPISKGLNKDENVFHRLNRNYTEKNGNDNISVFYFVQGDLGNCCMVALMSSLEN